MERAEKHTDGKRRAKGDDGEHFPHHLRFVFSSLSLSIHSNVFFWHQENSGNIVTHEHEKQTHTDRPNTQH